MQNEKKLYVLCLIVITASLSCEEELPSRSDPNAIFRASIEASYALTAELNQLFVRMSLVNKYDEVLEEQVTLGGAITVDLPRVANGTKTFVLSAANLAYAPNFDSTSNILRIPPGDSVVFQVTYEFKDDTNRNLVNLFLMHQDTVCSFRDVSSKEVFVLKGTAKVFTPVTALTATTLFPICWVSVWVNPKFCTPILTAEDACVGH